MILCLHTYAIAQDTNALRVDTNTSLIDTIQESKIVKKKASVVLEKVRNKDKGLSNKGRQFFIGLGIFLLFGVIRFFYGKYISELFTALSRSALWRLNTTERLWQNWSVRYLFQLIYYLTAGFVIGRIIGNYVGGLSPFTQWMFGSGIAFGMSLFKYIMLQSVALVFRFKNTANDFFRHLSVINQVTGVILLPFCGFLLVSPEKIGNILLLLTGLVICISLIFKFLVNVVYVRNLSKVNYMHFMVYLCTLELIPLAVLARYLYSGLGA